MRKALKHCERLLSGSHAVPGGPWLREVYKHYGSICRMNTQYELADIYLARAEHLAEESGDLLLAAEVAREQAEMYWEQRRHRNMLRALNRAHGIFSQLRASRDLAYIDRHNTQLESRFLEIVRKWGDSIEGMDRYTQGHCERVATLACTLASHSGFSDRELFWCRVGALLHDVGKLIVPAEILNKPGPLTPDEWALMKRHPVAGIDLLGDIDFPWDVRPMVRNHHERWDGRGYPDGLSGMEIPFAARILSVADVYDALTTTRSYRPAFSHEDAVSAMLADRGRFDPELIGIFTDRVTTTMRPEGISD
jgi:putative nucleotidyltransferase with HDIG domain